MFSSGGLKQKKCGSLREIVIRKVTLDAWDPGEDNRQAEHARSFRSRPKIVAQAPNTHVIIGSRTESLLPQHAQTRNR